LPRGSIRTTNKGVHGNGLEKTATLHSITGGTLYPNVNVHGFDRLTMGGFVMSGLKAMALGEEIGMR
jgi:hypothetical protein